MWEAPQPIAVPIPSHTASSVSHLQVLKPFPTLCFRKAYVSLKDNTGSSKRKQLSELHPNSQVRDPHVIRITPVDISVNSFQTVPSSFQEQTSASALPKAGLR